MSVDVVLKARLFKPPMSSGDFEELRGAFIERWPSDSYYDDKPYRYPDIGFDRFEDVQTLKVHTMWRYYGSGYERGPWPEIRDMGDWLALAIGERGEVRYGGDTNDEWDALTPWPEVRAENDEHWRRFGTEPYDSRWRSQS